MKKAIYRGLAWPCLAVVLAACGGGGGGGGGGGSGGGGTSSASAESVSAPPPAVAESVTGPSWASISPGRVDLRMKQFHSQEFGFRLRSSRQLAPPFSLQVRSNPKPVLQSAGLRFEEKDDGSFWASMDTDTFLEKGEHVGTLEIRLCEGSNYLQCDKPMDEPWHLPYRFVVTAD